MLFDILRHAGLAFVAILGFAVLFDVPPRSLLACGLTGVAGYLGQTLALRLGLAPVAAAFAGAALIGLCSELSAQRLKLPATVFIVTGFIPLVPGVAATRAMIELISGDYGRGGPNAVNAALITGAIAAGIGGLGAAARALRLRRENAVRP